MAKLLAKDESDADFDFSNLHEEEKTEHETVTVWIPKTHKEKFDELQARSKKKFGKKLKRIIVQAIELADQQNKITA